VSSSKSVEHRIGRLLVASGLTLSVAESCTGGLISHRVTKAPGASAYFLGGVVAYSNEAKIRFLDVARLDIETYGAVSEQVARQMAAGVRRRFRSDAALGVTGIAGPAGGTAEKPVGLVFIACSVMDATWAARRQFGGARGEIMRQAAEAALCMLAERIG